MHTWFTYLKQGLSRKIPDDRIAGNQGRTGIKAKLKNLLPYLKGHRRRAMLGVLLIFAASLFAFPPPLITRFLVDEVILGRQLELLAGAVLLLVGCLVAEKGLRVLEDFYFARFEQRITLAVQNDLISRVLRFPKSFFDDNQSGYLQSRISEDVEGLRWFFSGTIVHVISNALRFLGGVAFLFYLDWKLSLAVLILLPGMAWFIRFISGRIHILSHQSMEQKAEVTGRIQESLSEASLIKAFAAEDRTRNRLISSLRKGVQISLELITINSLANLVIQSMPGLARAVTLAVGAFWIIQDRWTLGSLLAFQAYLAYVFGPAQYLASANLQLQKALASLERVSALFDIVPEENTESRKKASALNGEIEFKNVSFGYNGYEPVLKDVSLHIRAGERVAIVGPNGVGKTSLISLIMRFYQPTSGEILFDGRPASDYDVGSLRRRIGYASQQPRLLAGTVFENLRYGNPDADKAQVHQAAKIAGVLDVIESLPHGYETVLGEKGVNLSQGQRQRISLARALIKDPDILVLDEPTAALDSVVEKSIFDALPTMVRDKTLFIVAHRLSTIRNCDRVLLLNEKRLAAAGTHEALLESNETYRGMLSPQQMESFPQ